MGTFGGLFALYNVFHLRELMCKWLIRLDFSPPSHFPGAGRSMPQMPCPRKSYPIVGAGGAEFVWLTH